MRTVKIARLSSKSHPYAAMDVGSGLVVLKHQNEAELIALCRRLEWTIDIGNTDVVVTPEPPYVWQAV